MTTCQKCIRTGDIDNVGKTLRHGTFFEMLGNFSFGDYFKKESLSWGWDFLTKVLEIPKERLWATIYRDDDEAYAVWRSLGMPEKKIIRLGKEDNFWEIGLGPCGPDSEIFYDRGEEYGCGKKDCKPGCECERFVEVWNHVFTQFSREEDGSYSRLRHPNIDTGMGLERIACVMQGVDSIFDIDTVRHILNAVLAMAGKEYEKEGTEASDISVRIITDHLRSMVFMISDTILPSNEGRGYVLRRLIRRASRHGRLLGIQKAFLADLADRVIESSGEAYPELVDRRTFIKEIIAREEEKFEQTLDQGMDIINGYIEDMEEKGSRILSGEKTFKLYDTFGFPPELTAEILEEKGYQADMAGFAAAMQVQKERARANRKETEEYGWDAIDQTDIVETEFTGYQEAVSQARVLFVAAEEKEGELREGQTGIIYLDKTPFYPQGGGQVSDKGILSTETAEAFVYDVSRQKGRIAHKVKIRKGSIRTGDIVTAAIDLKKRHMTARNHTATHLLQKSLQCIVGDHIHQAGSYVDDRILRFDFTNFSPLSPEDIDRVEALVNEKIQAFLPVVTTVTTPKEAEKAGAMALFEEKYGDRVRMVACGDFSLELCGGTHVDNTGALGAFRILSESGIASGIRRIEAVTALGIEEREKVFDKLLSDLSRIVKTARDQLPEKIYALTDALKEKDRLLEKSKEEKLEKEASLLLEEAVEQEGIKLIRKHFSGLSAEELRLLSDHIKTKSSATVAIFASEEEGRLLFLLSITDDLVQKGFHAGKMIKEIAALCGGGGGGKAGLAQAGGKNPAALDAAFSLAEKLVFHPCE